jgi:predicted RNase H-like nuclease
MPWVAGVDACRNHWFVVLHEISSHRITCRVIHSIAEVLTFSECPTVVAVDCPIGLSDQALPGGRECDRIARKLLGFPRATSVFPVPARSALSACSYDEACAINAASSVNGLRLARQTFGLFPRSREVDEFITPARQKLVVEAHPELCFYELNGGAPIKDAKKTPQVKDARFLLLSQAGLLDSFGNRPQGVTVDDMLDAYAVCWTAERIELGHAKRIPETPDADSKGLRMEMWR